MWPSASWIAAAAFAWMFGRKCVYVSSVIPTVEWPGASDAIFGCTPLLRSLVGKGVSHIVEAHPAGTGLLGDPRSSRTPAHDGTRAAARPLRCLRSRRVRRRSSTDPFVDEERVR